VLIRLVEAPVFGTNCYVVAAAEGEPGIIIDPGIGVLPALDEVLAKHRIQPVAVMLTHGHLDHTFSVAPLCTARDSVAYIHPADEELLRDPTKGISAGVGQLLDRFGYVKPADVAELPDGGMITVAGLEITVDHAPGHTMGSVLFRHGEICFSGDVLFAGSIGRTDLYGGSWPMMQRSLRDKILPLPDEVVVYPGHGPATTIGRERRTNPYLQPD
jgi:glyoxylase-like metal-dependent hydrolase (beta-lactamase superfamily II)